MLRDPATNGKDGKPIALSPKGRHDPSFPNVVPVVIKNSPFTERFIKQGRKSMRHKMSHGSAAHVFCPQVECPP